MRLSAVVLVLLLTGCSTFTVEADVTEHVTGQWDVRRGTHDISDEPLARLSVGFEPRISETVTAVLAIEHKSFPAIRNDRGDESVRVGLRWQPFRP